MSAPRFLVGAIGAPGEEVPLPADESRHVRSRRLADGAPVVLLDGAGGRAEGTLASEGRSVRVVARVPARGEPTRRVTLLLAAAEPARVEWAVEKGTECGASRFVLAACARSQAGHVRALAGRLERLRRIAAEAVKQSDRTRVPEVDGPFPLEEALAAGAGPLFVARPGAPRLPGELPTALTAAIGPEGGFADDEHALFSRFGAVPFGLGPRILRLETAAVVALSFLVESS